MEARFHQSETNRIISISSFFSSFLQNIYSIPEFSDSFTSELVKHFFVLSIYYFARSIGLYVLKKTKVRT